MDVDVFYHFLESRDTNGLLLVLPLNRLISKWLTWKMSILPKAAASPFSGDCPTRHWEFPSDRPTGGGRACRLAHGNERGIKPRTLLPGCKNWDKQKMTPYGHMQKFYYQKSWWAAFSNSLAQFPAVLPTLQQIFMGGTWKIPQQPHQIMVFPLRLTVEFSSREHLLQSWLTGSVWGIS